MSRKYREAILTNVEYNSTYQIVQHVVAKFSEDLYHRARIESYSSSSQTYTVYFLDYGNIIENISIGDIYSSSNDLDAIEPQGHRYLLGNIKGETWIDIVRPLIIQEKLNNTIEFCFTDKNNSIIHIKFDNENNIYCLNESNEQNKLITNEQTKIITANISAIDQNYFYIHILPDDILNIFELKEILQTYIKQKKTTNTWAIYDLCIVSNNQIQYYRGQILSINDNKYDVKCIDYGNILENLTYDHLYELPDQEIFKQSSLAHQCQLYDSDDINKSKTIEEIIKNMELNKCVKFTIENDRNDPCLFVRLIKENNEIVNDKYQFVNNNQENNTKESNNKKNEIILSKLSDSNITSDDSNIRKNDKNSTLITKNISLLSKFNNQTIDSNKNDLLTSTTTTKDETNNLRLFD